MFPLKQSRLKSYRLRYTTKYSSYQNPIITTTQYMSLFNCIKAAIKLANNKHTSVLSVDIRDEV